MPDLAAGEVCISRNAVRDLRVEQKGFRQRQTKQFAVGKLCALHGALLHLHVGEIALRERAIDERRARKRTARELAAHEAAAAERQPRIRTAFEREVFKEGKLDVRLVITGRGKQGLDVVTRG